MRASLWRSGKYCNSNTILIMCCRQTGRCILCKPALNMWRNTNSHVTLSTAGCFEPLRRQSGNKYKPVQLGQTGNMQKYELDIHFLLSCLRNWIKAVQLHGVDADALWGRYPPPLQEHKYCSTIARNKETLDPLNLHFLHFLLHSIKALYLTQRDSCWKAAKALSTLFFPP